MKTTPLILAAFTSLLFAWQTSAVPVTFEVNMEHQITNDFPTFDPLNDTVEVRGNFHDNWNSGIALVRVGSTTSYTNTFNVTEVAPGATVEFKFHIYGPFTDNWENLPGYIYVHNGNRAFVLANASQKLPAVYFSDRWGGTTPLTFRVDMKPQTLAGNFIPGDDTLEVRGSWDNFSSGVALTNDPASGASNIYSQTFAVAAPAPGGLAAYKFHYYGPTHDIWETLDNRFVLVTNPVTTLPVVCFNNLGTNDILFSDTLVTFQVNMTNAIGINSYVFDPNSDYIYINGDFLGWWSWGYFPPPQYQMFRVGNSEVYTNTFLVPKGTPLALTYKYSIAEFGVNAADNEAPFKMNHVRYIRNTGNCTFPLDRFGDQTVEPIAGAVNIGPLVSGRVNVTWNGHLGLRLQTTTNLTSGSWTDLPETDGQSATNYPVGDSPTFFRLIKPQ